LCSGAWEPGNEAKEEEEEQKTEKTSVHLSHWLNGVDSSKLDSVQQK